MKRFILICLTVLMTMSLLSTCFASDSLKAVNPITPKFIVIVKCWNSLTLHAGGRLTCCGKTEVDDGYIASVHVELQENGTNWTTIKDWSGSDEDYIKIENDWYVESGHSYRLKVTHSAYEQNHNFIESSTSYSQTVNY